MNRRTYTCPECKMPVREWTRNGGRGFEREGIWYCCQGCAQDNHCTCRKDARPPVKPKRQPLKPHPVEGHRLAGRAVHPVVVD